MKLNNLLSVVVLLIFATSSCKKDDSSISQETKEVNQFISNMMTVYYLWTDDMPVLNPNKQPDSEEYFSDLLFSSIDHWSFITDDYQGLVDYFSGIKKDYGYSVRPYLWEEGGDKVVAYVEFVYPGTPAERAGLKRGDLIVKINGTEINKENYTDLFYSINIKLGLGIDTDKDGNLEDLPGEYDLTAEVIAINPILRSTVFEMREGPKIGYLAYTSFIDKYDTNLEQVFASFKAQEVSELILDLRYNGGGSVATANLLASMIGPASTAGKIFTRAAYNNNFDEYFKQEYPNDESQYIDRFEGSDYNLNLSRLYVLTTGSTASASEMVMYTLSPYMEVIQIGEQTHGKYYASITLNDEESDHGWAIQPIIVRMENVDNSIDYGEGLSPSPDLEMHDDYSHELGTIEDVLTSVAIDNILGEGNTPQILKSSKETNAGLKDLAKPITHPLKYDMHIAKPE